MPKDFEGELLSKTIYKKVDSELTPKGLEGTFTIKFDFPTKADFINFVNSGGVGTWVGSKAETNFISSLIYQEDKDVNHKLPLRLRYVTYKDSLYDDKPVVVCVVSYIQENVK